MSKLNIIIPITKIDAETRTVYGVMTEEVPDKSGEIIDYESAKAEIQKWSDGIAVASDGKSLGNVRAMHGKVAAGKLTDIAFEDTAKRVDIAAKVVDDDEWQKCLEGVYTGFSMGGGYAKRWRDPSNPHLMRYTPTVTEVSLVDNPCVPSATFQYVKADGSVEMRKFTSTEKDATMTTQPAAEIENKPAAAAPVQGWQAEDGSFHLTKAAAAKKNEELALAKAVQPVTDAIAKIDEVLNKSDTPPAAEGEQADDTKDGAQDGSEAEKTAEGGMEKAADGEADKAADAADAGLEKAEGDDAAKEGDGAADAKADAEKAAPATLEKDASTATPQLGKGLYEVGWAAALLADLNCLADCIAADAFWDGKDAAQLPELKDIISKLALFLQTLVKEETDEMVAGTEESNKAAPTGRLAKAMSSLGNDALAKAIATNNALQKSVNDLLGKTDQLVKRVQHLESQPAPVKGVMRTVHKAPLEKGHNSGDLPAGMSHILASTMSPNDAAAAAQQLMKSALKTPQAIG